MADRALTAVFEADAPTPPTQYTVSVTQALAEGGTVSGGGTYDEKNNRGSNSDSKHRLSLRQSGQRTRSETSSSASYAFSATADRALVAVFEEDAPVTATYTVSVSANPAAAARCQAAGHMMKKQPLWPCGDSKNRLSLRQWTENSGEGSKAAALMPLPAQRQIEALSGIWSGRTYTADAIHRIRERKPAEGRHGVETAGHTMKNNRGNNSDSKTGYHFVSGQGTGDETSTSASYAFTATADQALHSGIWSGRNPHRRRNIPYPWAQALRRRHGVGRRDIRWKNNRDHGNSDSKTGYHFVKWTEEQRGLPAAAQTIPSHRQIARLWRCSKRMRLSADNIPYPWAQTLRRRHGVGQRDI